MFTEKETKFQNCPTLNLSNNSGKSTVIDCFSIKPVLLKVTVIALTAAFLYGTLIIWGLIPPLRQSLIDQKNETSKRIVEVVLSYFQQIESSFHNDPVKLSSAKADILERLRKIRFGKEGKDYFWIQGPPDDRIIMHPYRSDFENVNPEKVIGPDGHLLRILLTQIGEKASLENGDFIEYKWHHRDELALVATKISYVRKFVPWGWTIGTGIYLDDLENEVVIWKKRLLFAGLFTSFVAFIMALLISFRAEKAIHRELILKQNLLDQQQKYKILFEAANDAIILMDSDRILSCNNKAAEIFGRLKDDIRGRLIDDFFPEFQPDHTPSRESARKLIAQAYSGESLFFEWIHTRADGTEFPAEVSLQSLPTNDGTLLMAIIRDITTRKKAEMEIQRREELFRMVFENSPFGICFNDLESGQYLKVNPAFTKITGYEPSEVIGKVYSEILGSADIPESVLKAEVVKAREKSESVIRVLKEKGVVNLEEGTFFKKDGNMHYTLFTSVIVPFDGRDAILSLTVDVTERKILSEQLKQAGKMDVLGQLAGGIAHDFNNMLAAILGNGELLALDLPDVPELRASMNIILEGARRAADLTQKLLAFSRKGKVVSTSINIHDSINSTVALLERSIDRKITLVKNFKASEGMVSGDPTLLQNAFLNLAINARDAMPDGGTITFSTDNISGFSSIIKQKNLKSAASSYLVITISDTGTGIPEKLLSRIFEPFFTTKAEGAGTGLGLAAVYGTVMEHMGEITVDSEPGKGTTFTIYLPNAGEKAENSVESIDEPLRGSGRILVVDDESIIRSTTHSMLSMLGYEVILAEDGEMALEIVERANAPFDAILIDMVMPKLSGREVLEGIRKFAPDARIIMTSGFDREDHMIELRRLGADAFLQKPYRLSKLSRILVSSPENENES
ncbi:MAG: hypothetical protein CVV64_14690 [Candidatus Wallbacteria bacterium HGW-Wallbacteria-1]|jgi:PAS domain S-box-containing protein|uniref:histidine kinase n=1 Tax=Candidatus Wallbacteria bacterium HGW-Wallbacteria-1 TaxID=2013854 RepID=A0A2N1PM15_9BACT|nr:MAG: hypothetical protein CVV64_14690 [Candidatus Wallbacteria bacterium HGW-Wallbacteria-1]